MSIAKKFACSIIASAQKIFSVFEWTAGSVESAGGRSKIGLEEPVCGALAGEVFELCCQTPTSAIPPNFIISRRESVDILHTSYRFAGTKKGTRNLVPFFTSQSGRQ